MNDLNLHYRQLLGLSDDWKVADVNLDLDGTQVTIELSHTGGQLVCPECETACSKADTAPQRKWRHLDAMQFTTEIHAAIPRCNCAKCGVKTIAVPWASKHSRFTLMFEAFGVRVLLSASNVKKAAELLGLSWNVAHRIMEAAVDRGLRRRETEDVKHVVIDEKSFGRGHDYVSILTDIGGARVLEVAPERTIAACDSFLGNTDKNAT